MFRRKRIVLGFAGSVGCLLVLTAADFTNAQVPVGSAFTYQGQLKHNGAVVTDICDIEFTLWDDAMAGLQIDTTETLVGVDVRGGLFTVQLDFGPTAFDGDARWLAMAVKCSPDTDFVPLNPRQPITPAPYSVHSASPAGIPSGVIAMWSGTRDTIPSGWALCDGTNGTPDLQETFVYGIHNTEDPGAVGGSVSHTHSEEYPDRRWRVLSNVQYQPNSTDADTDFCLPDYDPTPLVVDVEAEGAKIQRIIEPPGPSVGSLSNVLECFPDKNVGNVVSGPSRRTVVWHRAYKQGMSTENHLPTYYKLAFIMKL